MSESVVGGGLPSMATPGIATLDGEHILLFSPSFFEYGQKMKDEIERLGARCDLFDERCVKTAEDKALLKVAPFLFSRRAEEHYRRILDSAKGVRYDRILVIKGDMVSPASLALMRETQPGAIINLFLWDSVANTDGVAETLQLYDAVYSFDPADCLRYQGLRFRPDFFCDEYRGEQGGGFEAEHDILFVGTIHSDRQKVLEAVDEEARALGLRSYSYRYLQSEFMFPFYRATKREFKSAKKTDFRYEPLSSASVAELARRSVAILDIQHPGQVGLTTRPFEMMALGRKIITTNPLITQYDFYDPQNIFVIDRNDVRLERDFFELPYRPVPEEIYESYSLKTWVLTVLS